MPMVRVLSVPTIGFIALLIPFALTGCSATAPPIPDTTRIALTPTKGQITMAARPGTPIGDLVPVDIGVANGTDEPYRIEPGQVFAINSEGQRVMPVPPDQAIAVAGQTNAFKAGLAGAGRSAVAGGLKGAARGAAIGAIVGLIVASPVQGAMLGAAMGGSVGAASGGIIGGFEGQAAAHRTAATQISSLSLQTSDANPNYSINGFVYFPKGIYTSVEMNLLNEETHQSATCSSSWDGVPRPTWDGETATLPPEPIARPPAIAQPPAIAKTSEQPQFSEESEQEPSVKVLPPTHVEPQDLPTYTE
jgi:hypothetical protein